MSGPEPAPGLGPGPANAPAPARTPAPYPVPSSALCQAWTGDFVDLTGRGLLLEVSALVNKDMDTVH